MSVIEIETSMWNPPESEYILIDDIDSVVVHSFKAHGWRQAEAVQAMIDYEWKNSTTLYIKVAHQD